jgi:hypoxanthine phosphoribosyltransferase
VIADELKIEYADKNPLFIAILNGSFMLAADVMKAVDFDCEITFTRLSSYQAMSSSGTVSTILGFQQSLKNRHLIILEDIIDTGRTMNYFMKSLQTENPASVAIVTLLVKPSAVVYPVNIDYAGFEIEDKFVIGYGLDYDEQGRQYRDIYQLA